MTGGVCVVDGWMMACSLYLASDLLASKRAKAHR